MPPRLIGDLTIARDSTSQAFVQFVRQLRACRECGETAGFFDKICKHCGAGSPVRIPISASVIIVAIVAQAAIVVLRVM